jgi:eukaryotic-like serine/threonine-protein kinase
MSGKDFGSDDATVQSGDSTITFPSKSQLARTLQAGASLGRYRLTRCLGRGGFGEVWEAEDVGAGRQLALKVLTQFRRGSPEVLRRFKREGQLAASLNHPRTVYVFGAEEIDGHPVIAMELMPGGTLQDQVLLLGRLPLKQAIDFILDIIEGLEAAQHAGIVHRDVKPSNCFIDEEGRAKIGDFGISKTLEPQDNVTGEKFVGTPAYASPEQVRGRDVDFRSDIYSVGATLYTLLTGKPPFEGPNPGELLARILSEDPVTFTAHQVNLPPRLYRIIGRCMAKNRQMRYRNYAALRADLLPFSSSYRLTIGNLTKRAAAFAVDEAIIALSFVAVVNALGSGWAIETTEDILHFLYYLLLEAFWGRTLGKYLMGLTVTDASGRAITFRQAFLRTSVFASIALPATLLELRIGPAPLLVLATAAVCISTMRRENGFAGPHELVSHTRVMAASVVVPVSTGSSRLNDVGNPDAEKRPASFGPYRVLKDIWRTESAALLLAFDEVLRRNVWIHVATSDKSRTPMQLSSIRPGKLRWLQGGESDQFRWEAFEAPQGVSFYEWVQSRGRLSWAGSRNAILGIAEEIEARLEAAEIPINLSLRHVWLDARGRPRLLHFPASVGGDSIAMVAVNGHSAKKFLQHMLWFALAGKIVLPDLLGTTLPSVPLPEHARATLMQICHSDPAQPLGAIAGELRRLHAMPAEVAMSTKAVMHAVIAGIPMLFLMAYLMAPFIDSLRLPEWRRDFERVPAYESLLTKMETYGNVPEAKGPREAACKLLSWIHREADTAPGGKRLLYEMRTFQRERLESCRKQYPSVTEQEAVKARGVVEKEIPIAKARFDIGRLERGATEIFWVGGFLWVIPVTLSFVFPPGAAASVFGFALQTTVGRRAGRWRCLARSFFAWSPFAMFFPILWFTSLLGYAPGLAEHWKNTGLGWATFVTSGYNLIAPNVDLVLGSTTLIGILYSIARPARALPDLLAGTCFVPK